jgi:hypothetical protein
MTNQDKDILIIRELCRRYLEICGKPDQQRRREMWRRLNGLEACLPLIYVRACAWAEMEASRCFCEDPDYRQYESFFRELLFWDTLEDDFIFEPWVTVPAAYGCQKWGVEIHRKYSDDPRGAYKVDYPIKEPADIGKMRFPVHQIDEERTGGAARKIGEAIGDLIPINVDRGPAYRMWTGDLSTDLGDLRGIENLMMDMMDRPEWLKQLVGFMRDGVLAVHGQAEKAGDWGLCDHQNQAMPYARELGDPAANANGVLRNELWGFMAGQEFCGVGPELWNEFLFEYQKPILEKFGLAAYGCCEDLTRKIPYLRRLKNLRRIAVSPFANVARCAEAIGGDYVVSYRPSPADMVSYGFDPERIRRIVRRDLEVCKANGCAVDITLKDVETVQKDPDRIRNWVRIVREIIDEVYG